MLRGATLSFCTTSVLRQLARAIFPAWIPWSLRTLPRTQTARSEQRRTIFSYSFIQPSAECITILTSSVHLTHLYTSALLMSDDADTRLDEILCALSTAPKLEYVGVDVLESGGYHCVRGFYVVRDGHGGYAGRRETLNWHKIRYHEWDDVFREIEVEW
ncbi:hypothetical protein DFH08DRAFT_977523 [Mycena albidolilacea]|uniref:Uncharacterized protein n=1 Tax=Mycena albidolilacea TaxID=1033008 RepID=A0AAD6Z127_9AGAR|nr:hypothetical protein DFH08DRAFT_977523 [Mycena albidolilacea]